MLLTLQALVQWELPGSENGGTMPYKAVFILGIIWSYIALNYIDLIYIYILQGS